LLQRGRTGKGDRIDISMLECLAEWTMPPMYVWRGTGRIPERCGVRHNMVVPYGAYACMDGPVMFAIQNEREWRRFTELVMGMPALADDDRFRTNAQRLQNRGELEAIIEARLSSLTRAEAATLLERAEIASGAVNDVSEVWNHPQLAARHRWVEVDSPVGKIPAMLPPHNLQQAAPSMEAVPALGQHTAEILAELGAQEN
jgi:itaconate CoA-transferase